MEKVNCLIVGGGPAGYTAAIYGARADISPVVYEGLQPGGQLTTTTDIENYPGFPEGIGGPELSMNMMAQATKLGLEVRYDEITEVKLTDEEKYVIAGGNKVEARTVILCMGATPRPLGVKDEDGNYRITGRIKDMIIRGGENIYPREIEEFLYKLEGIKDVQVAGIPSKRYGEAVGAFIILHEGVEMNEFDVREFCEGKIARYKIPKYIFFVKEFPMTGSGKIQKYKLKDVGLELCKKQGIEII